MEWCLYQDMLTHSKEMEETGKSPGRLFEHDADGKLVGAGGDY